MQEAGHKGILCDALGIAHYLHDLHELTLMVTDRITKIDIALRDQFAMAALTKLGMPMYEDTPLSAKWIKQSVKSAYMVADAMFKAREEER